MELAYYYLFILYVISLSKETLNKRLNGKVIYLIRGISCSVQHVLGKPLLAVSSVHVTLYVL